MKMSPTFRTLVNSTSKGEIIKPILTSYLYSPSFPAFTINIDGWTPRPPDGWFHPSTHPTQSETLLYHYINDPENLAFEHFDPTSVMTVTQGHFWHEFVQTCLLDAKVLVPNPVDTGRNPAEWFWSHEGTKARGWSDGLTNSKITDDEEIFEYKTMRAAKAAKIANGAPDSPEVLESFRRLAPEYYAQGQEYMRLSGRRRWRAIIMSLDWPFPIREIVMNYDPIFAGQTAMKYERVLQAVADQRPPLGGCCGGVKDCPARLLCSLS